ncbi:uncharacterized protein LOC115737082 isoform X2 [Rhodamnia argentea]|uniref:Uncharacterized protein LOC115737082 isoform X2 n=1 Tax=Rhodamnia argentea TaxID=178133 RepID=A0A8B8NQX1_9MYRT|nr:uncharacterized protein LOC115737082 isoform X2 [Rhodamnia argentea]
MDYDENDFQSQNQHLAGEGNAKFSPALQPYALSKFDFDDNLQGNLRFDSLVESEVFLGIANNVDNHWIEDFSRGNSGIEFSTCATVPCSIARHNNVWSEATSSESVEMLLKSVGQEETTLNRTTIGAADACNPATSTKEMEPNLTHDDSVFSNSEETVKPQLALVPDETLQNYSSIKEAMVDEPSQVEVASRTHSESFVGGMSVDVDPSALDGNSGAFKAEGSSPNNDKSDDKIPGEVHNLLAKPSNYSAEEAGSSLDVQGDNVVKVTDHITMSCNRVESQIALDQVNVAVENVDGLQTDIDVQGGEILAVSMEERRNSEISADNAAEISTSHLRCNANLSLKGQYKEEGNAVEAGVSTDQEPSTPGPQVMEGCSGDTSRIISVQASISEDNISAKDAGTVEQLEAEGKKVAVSVEPAVTGSEQSMDSNQQKTIMQTDTIDQKDDKSDCNEQQAKGSASLLLQVDDDKVLEKDGEGINSVSGHMTVGSLPRQHEETQASDSSKDADGRMGQQNVSGEKCSQSSSSVEIKQVERENEPEDNDRKDIHHHKKTLKSSGQELESMTIVNLEECEILTHADASCGTAEQQSSETVSQVKPVSDAGNTDILDASQATVLTVVNHETEKEPKASPDFCEPMVNKSDHIEMVPEKHGDTIAEEKFEKDLKDSENVLKASESFPKSSPSTECHERSRAQEEEIDNADSSKAECSSPIVISSSELSQEVNIEGADKNSSHQNVPSSDVKDSHVLVDQKGMDAAKDERSFTFDVSPLMRTEGSQKWQQFPALKDSKLSPIVEGSPLTPALVQVENKVLQPNATGSPRKSRDAVRGHLKDTPERKTRRTSSKAAGKESAKKGISAKATAALKKSEAGASSYRSLSPSGIYQVVQSNEMQHFGQVDGTNAKPFGVLNTAASSLPDLNTSALGNVVFQQPFTDLQQVQLRAQIFVYGSLISKVAPEEAHMLSAFGGPDGGRSMWENALRKCRERILGQTVHPASIETPSQSRLASDQATKQNIVPNKATPSPVGRGTSKSTPSPATNPLLPLSSPLWNISTPSFEALQSLPKGAGRDYQAFSPVHLNQTPPLGNYFGHSTTWMSQTPFRASWSASQNSVLDPSVRFPSLPMNEAVKLVPVKESPVSLSSAMKNVAPGPVKKDAVQASVLPGSSVASLDAKKETVSPGQPSTDPKSRKRKKALNSGDLGQITTQSHSLVHPGSLAALTGHQSAPVPAASSTGFLSEASMGKHNMSVPSPIPPGNSKAVEQDKKSVLPEESIIKVEEARQQAEDAAAFAAAAIGHSQEIWNQLNKQKDSGLRAAAEVTLASAAVAIAAAASVAKAAAAAASVASNAALQAKLMAEEALSPNGNSQISNDGFSLSALGVTKSSSSIIVAAKEAARRRIEAASAASLRAENLDAIVKAAELAAEAITQAGKVVTMGDSLPISQLIEAGPDGFWKMPQVSSNHGAELHDGNREQSNNNNTYSKPGASGKQLAGPVQDKGTSGTQHALPPTSGESLGDKSEKHGSLTDGVSSLVNSDGKNFRGLKGRKASDLAGTTAGGNHVSAVSHEEFDETSRKSKESGIAVGSQVEVFKDGDGYKAAWFSANVLSLKDGKVYLCYSEIASNEGTGKLKEWVELGSEVDKAPRVRIAHPMTALKSEGTRKRRRAAVGDFLCSVGDKVDAWMRDCWWEGEVAEKSKRDGTSVTVHFPAHGETSVIRTWQLRPSLMWKDGEWIEWSSMRENVQTHQEGDMPQEKRARLGTPGLESKGKDKVQESVQVVEPGNHQVVESLDLTAKEKTFDIGKKNTIESRIDRLKSARTGLRKEGSRVVIGVPKPGKKRKFMEVSKHYVGNQKTEELNDSVKLANYLMPLRSGPRGWKNFSKDDTKEKRMVESKPKILRSGRSQNVSSRTIPQKNNLTTAGSSYGALAGIKSKDSSDHDHDENASEKHNSAEHGSFSNSEGVTEGPISSLIPSSDASSLKRTFIASAKAERANKGKVPGGKVATHEDKSFSRNATNAASEAVEPRRSNRRIQPTSRLLEGLQSSMIITKMPSTSHDRGHRIQSKGTGENFACIVGSILISYMKVPN